MTIDELEWYVVLAETEHMTEAAARLNIAQPTLSRALSRLERQVGAPLFDRVNRRLRLNQFGEILLAHARRSLSELDSATARIAALRDPERGTIRLAFLYSVASWLMPDLIRRYRAEAPDVRFDLRQAAGHEVLNHLREGHADLGVTGPRPDAGDIGWHMLDREQLCLVVPRGHRLAGLRQVSLADADGEPFIVLRGGFGLRRLTDELCAAAGIDPRIAFESSEIPSVEGLAAAGLGVAVVPAPRPHRAEPEAVYVPLTDRGAHRMIGLIWLQDQPQPPVVTRFTEFLKSGRRA